MADAALMFSPLPISRVSRKSSNLDSTYERRLDLEADCAMHTGMHGVQVCRHFSFDLSWLRCWPLQWFSFR